MATKTCTDDAEDFSDFKPYLEPYTSPDSYGMPAMLDYSFKISMWGDSYKGIGPIDYHYVKIWSE